MARTCLPWVKKQTFPFSPFRTVGDFAIAAAVRVSSEAWLADDGNRPRFRVNIALIEPEHSDATLSRGLGIGEG